jgi:hypothetical protein
MAPAGCGTALRAETNAGARSRPSDPRATKLAAESGEGRTLPREELGELGELDDGGIFEELMRASRERKEMCA